MNFVSTHRYSAVNRLYENFQVALNIEQVDDGYFKLTVQPSGKVLGVTKKNDEFSVEPQELNGNVTQHWDIIPTGDGKYYRIKSRTKVFNQMDFMFLQAEDKSAMEINVARRDDTYLGQQWRFV